MCWYPTETATWFKDAEVGRLVWPYSFEPPQQSSVPAEDTEQV
jgi:hypothetical protein